MNLGGRTIGLIAAGAALVIAPFLPAISAAAALIGQISRSAVDLTSGEALVLSVIGVIVAYFAWQSHLSGNPMRRVIVPLGGIALAYAIYLYVTLDERVSDATFEGAFASVGMGVYLALVASLAVILFAFWTLSESAPSDAESTDET